MQNRAPPSVCAALPLRGRIGYQVLRGNSPPWGEGTRRVWGVNKTLTVFCHPERSEGSRLILCLALPDYFFITWILTVVSLPQDDTTFLGRVDWGRCRKKDCCQSDTPSRFRFRYSDATPLARGELKKKFFF